RVVTAVKVDAIALDLRPRSMFEACDLGVRIVSANLRSVWASCLPVYVLVLCACAAVLPWSLNWSIFALFWLKPWFDRSILFVLARAIFGQPTRFADLWAARRAVFVQGWLGALTMRRLSPWRSFVQPVKQLEGQRGKTGRQRIALILGAHRGAAFGMLSAFQSVELAVTIGLWTLPAWLVPADDRGSWLAALFTSDHPWMSILYAASYALAVLLVEPFFVGAGFAMYLNRRVELEAWDIEQEFRLAFAS
ncbi:MAG: hypothetical protein ABIO71_12805, partial [Caldimonas sp.]